PRQGAENGFPAGRSTANGGGRRRGWWPRSSKRRGERAAFHHHQTALALVRTYEIVYSEDLRVPNLVRNRHLAKSISDAGWYQFRTTLTYKAACTGNQVLVVDPADAAQDCSACGERVPTSLSVRTRVYLSCGFISCSFIADRDHNVALTIVRAGQVR